MKTDAIMLNKIYDKTDGCCHLCHKKLSFSKYGTIGAKGAWHIEHSIPKANGGTDHLNNLYPACISCNCEKGASHNQTIRKRNRVNRAPYNKEKKQNIREENTLIGIIGGGFIGAVFGPLGIIFCSLIGGAIGEDLSPDR